MTSLFLAIALGGCRPAVEHSPYDGPRVVVLVLDGVRDEESFGDTWSQVVDGPPSELMPRTWEQLVPQGSRATHVHSAGLTLTGPGHATMLSGVRQAFGNYEVLDEPGAFRPELPTIFEELRLAHADGTYPNLLRKIAKTQLLIVDDFGSAALDARERRDLREILEGRYSVSSTIVTSQLAPQHWHSFIGDDTVADAICDRLIHNAHRLELDGESMRKIRGLDGDGDGNGEGAGS